MAYPLDDPQRGVSASPNLPEVERRVLDFWTKDDTFKASIEARPTGENGANEFVFYDGPPFANGLPHYGHLLTGYVKDIVPRYQTMRGRHVERRFGWDTHGMPAEVTTEKELGLKSKADIEAYGVDRFNAAAKASVLQFTDEWVDYVTRQARWVDFENDYKTLDLTYMESVMWAFKTLYDKGLIYEGYRVLWYCWRCETPLAATETKMDDTYQNRQDPAVTVGLDVTDEGPLEGVKLLVWTTTPWTLPSNLAAAVHPDVDYVVVETEGSRRGPHRRLRARTRRRGRRRRPLPRRRARRPALQPAVRLLRRPRQRPPGARRRLRHHRRRHRRRPHRPRLR
jgi:isoleucyl-tRNA synthetase